MQDATRADDRHDANKLFALRVLLRGGPKRGATGAFFQRKRSRNRSALGRHALRAGPVRALAEAPLEALRRQAGAHEVCGGLGMAGVEEGEVGAREHEFSWVRWRPGPASVFS